MLQQCLNCGDTFSIDEGRVVGQATTYTGIEDVIECPSCRWRQLVDERVVGASTDG